MATAEQVRDLFDRYGVDPAIHADGTEAQPDQRIDRIALEIDRGDRTLAEVEDAIARVGVAQEAAPPHIISQVADLFDRHGLNPNIHADQSQVDGADRIEDIAREVAAGERTLESVEADIMRVGVALNKPSPFVRRQIKTMFDAYGIDPAMHADGTRVDPGERVDRIALEIADGDRTFADVTEAVARYGDESPTGAATKIAVRNLFERYNVDPRFHYGGSTTDDPDARIRRIAADIDAGVRSLQDVEGWVSRTAERWGDEAAPGSPALPDPAEDPDPGDEDPDTPDGPEDDLEEEVARNAQEELEATLSQWFDPEDVERLAEAAWEWLLEGRNIDWIMVELQDHEVFRERFPAIHERREAGLSPISPTDYLEYEKNARQLAKAAGMPRGLVEDRIDELIAGNVSLRSLSQRLEDGYRQAMDAPQEVRDELQRLGYTDGHLAGFFLDPDRGMAKIEQDFRAGQVAGAAILSRFGSLDRSEAEQLVDYGAEYETALEGLSELAESAQLFGQLPGEIGMEAVDREDQFAAQFGGDAEVRSRIERNVARRVGAFRGGGGTMLSQRGATGLGAGGF